MKNSNIEEVLEQAIEPAVSKAVQKTYKAGVIDGIDLCIDRLKSLHKETNSYSLNEHLTLLIEYFEKIETEIKKDF